MPCRSQGRSHRPTAQSTRDWPRKMHNSGEERLVFVCDWCHVALHPGGSWHSFEPTPMHPKHSMHSSSSRPRYKEATPRVILVAHAH